MSCEVTTASLSNLFTRQLYFKVANKLEKEPSVSYDRFVFVANGSVEIDLAGKKTKYSYPHIVCLPANSKPNYKSLVDDTLLFSLYILHDKETKKVIDPSMIPDGANLEDFGIPNKLLNNE